MLRGMVTLLLENGQIETTLTRAKEVRSMAEKMITLGKKNTLASRRAALAYITKEDYEGLKADILLHEGDEVVAGAMTFKVMETPGHTRGGVCYICEDCIFSGDTLFRQECGRTDLEGGSYPEILRSLKRLHDLEGDYNVLPGHEGFSMLSHERKYNPYMKEAVK